MRRLFIIGASNFVKLRPSNDDLLQLGCHHQVVNLSVGGFSFLNEGKVKRLVSVLKRNKIANDDYLVIEFLSNSMVLGQPGEPRYWRAGGVTHYCYQGWTRPIGNEEMAVLMANISLLTVELPQVLRIVVMPPPPRYLSGPCCSEYLQHIEGGHFRNWLSARDNFVRIANARVKYVASELRKTFKNVIAPTHNYIANSDQPGLVIHVLAGFEGADRIHLNSDGLAAYWKVCMASLKKLSALTNWDVKKPHFPLNRLFKASDERAEQHGYRGGRGAIRNPSDLGCNLSESAQP